jgi:hypothetical protein
LSSKIWEQVTKETNDYASKHLAKITEGKSYDEEQWFSVTVYEMKAHSAQCYRQKDSPCRTTG